MRIDLVPSEQSDRAADALRALTGTPAEFPLRVHAGLGPGLFELVQGLAQTYTHKRALGFIKGNSPAFEHVTPYFLREAYQMQTVPWAQLDVTAWVESLKKETLFVMLAEDHPFTGALENVDAIDAALNEKKIYVVRVSHAAHAFRRENPRPYTMRVCSVDGGLAYSVSGARLRPSPAFSHRVPWSVEDVQKRFGELARAQENRAAVEAFENEFAAQRFFTGVHARLHDRAVLSFTDVSGEALLQAVAARTGAAAFGADAETANLCRWDSTRLLKGWWDGAPADDAIRGLVAFSSEACARKDLAKQVRASYEEVLARQTW